MLRGKPPRQNNWAIAMADPDKGPEPTRRSGIERYLVTTRVAMGQSPAYWLVSLLRNAEGRDQFFALPDVI